MPPNTTTVTAAQRELARGHQPVAIPPNSKGPKTPEWHKIRYSPDRLPSAFTGKNIGLLLGVPSGGLVDVDLDCSQAVIVADTFLPATNMIAGRVSRPRTHRFHRVDVPPASAIQFRDPRDSKMLIELRSSDGTKAVQTVIPPSVHPDGESYVWDEDGEPSRVDAASLLTMVKKTAAAALLARTFPAEGRHEWCLALAGGLMRRGWDIDATQEFIYAVAEAGGSDDPGTRAGVAEYTKLRLDNDEPATGFNRLAELIGPEGSFVIGAVHEWLGLEDTEQAFTAEHLTELGVAERVCREHEGELFFVPERGEWFKWDGRRWIEDATKQIWEFAIKTIRNIGKEAETKLATCNAQMLEILEMRASAKRTEALEVFDPKVVDAAQMAMKALAFSRSMETKAKISAVVELTEALPTLIKRYAELDSDPWLFNVSNGTLDLRTGELRQHRREDYITKIAEVVYDRGARAPRFDAFLHEVIPDAELRAYVQRAHGYTLTGLTTEQCMFICIGTGANGKSVLSKVRRAYMGEYMKTTPSSTFLEKRGGSEGPRNDVAALVGARLVGVSETPRGRALDETLIKAATSGDVLSARFLHKEFFDYIPQFKLWMDTNHRPSVAGADDGIWRRLRLVPFSVTIDEDKQNKDLDQQLIREELSGVLRWAVDGCLAWQRHKLGKPVLMQDELEEYRETSDPLSEWIETACELTGQVTAKELWQSYTSFCVRNGTTPMTREDVSDYLRQRRLRQTKFYVEADGQRKQVRGWIGISCRSKYVLRG
jgi:putative DNA primase/helicase